MESNIIQFPSTRKHLQKLAMAGADKILSNLGNRVGYLKMLGESDIDFRKRVMEKLNAANR